MAATHLIVTDTEMVTPTLRRVWFRGDDLSAFAASAFTDRYVKLVFLKDGVDYPEPFEMRALRDVLAPEDMPTVRTYTALFPDVDAGTVAIDFGLYGVPESYLVDRAGIVRWRWAGGLSADIVQQSLAPLMQSLA